MEGLKVRKLLSFILTLVLVTTAIPLLGAAAPAKKLYVNDMQIDAQPAVYMSGSVTMVPLKITAQTLGYSVGYNAVERSIKLTKGNETATLYLGKNQYVQGASPAVKLSAATTAVAGQSVVPTDFFRTILNCGVVVNAQEVRIYQDPILGAANANVTINAGDSFSVSLSENISTGYVWSFSMPDDTSISLVSTATVTPDPTSGIVGAPSAKTWVFQTEKTGKYVITFTSKRGSDVGATYQYTIQVAERTSKSSANVSSSKLTMGKNDRLAITLTENAATGFAWNYSGIPKSSVVTTKAIVTTVATTDGQIYTTPDGTTAAAVNAGDSITALVDQASGGTEAISLVSRTTAINTKAEGFVGEPTLRTMNFRARRAGTYELRLEYNRSFAKVADPKTVLYEITVK